MIHIERIIPEKAEEICRKITVDLPEYFGLPECNEQYASGVRACQNLAAKVDGKYVALISFDFPYPTNSNIYWMGVLRQFQRKGLGRLLLIAAWNYAKEKGAATMTVETLAPSEQEENYLKTYKFYESQGFEPLLNLKPQNYAWDMVYMVKNLSQIPSNPHTQLTIKLLEQIDIPNLVENFAAANWPKPSTLFEKYFGEQQLGERLVWVAFTDGQLAGYITLKWQSEYAPFQKTQLPEIMDFNVLPDFRCRGIGSKLLETAEQEASKKSASVGLGVGLYEGYGAAQKLYVKHGYIPDGRPLTYNYQPLAYGDTTQLDDNLVLWFTKKLKN